MPTKQPRLNVVLEQEVFRAVERLAKKGKKSLSLVARDLICDALEVHEDVYWASEAGRRDKKSTRWDSRRQVWA